MEREKQVSHILEITESLMAVLDKLIQAYDGLVLSGEKSITPMSTITEWEIQCYDYQSDLMKSLITYLRNLGESIDDNGFYREDQIKKTFLGDKEKEEDMKKVKDQRVLLDAIKLSLDGLLNKFKNSDDAIREVSVEALNSMAKVCFLTTEDNIPVFDVSKELTHEGFYVEGFEEIDVKSLLMEVGYEGPSWLGDAEYSILSMSNSLIEVLNNLLESYEDQIGVLYRTASGEKNRTPMSTVTEWEVQCYDHQCDLMKSIIAYLKDNLGEPINDKGFYKDDHVKKTFLEDKVKKEDMEKVRDRQVLLNAVKSSLNGLWEKFRNQDMGALIKSLVCALESMGKNCSLQREDGDGQNQTDPVQWEAAGDMEILLSDDQTLPDPNKLTDNKPHGTE